LLGSKSWKVCSSNVRNIFEALPESQKETQKCCLPCAYKEIRIFLKIKYGLLYDETLSKLIKEQTPIWKEKGRYKKRGPSSNQETSSQSTNT
jgi:hypothetical protein